MNDGGPAFPIVTNDMFTSETGFPGMSLRDWFAGMALSPILTQAYGATPHILAQKAYEQADAMLKERENDGPS